MEKNTIPDLAECNKMIQPVSDALYILNGKWKLPILIALHYGNKRFGQLAKEIPHITEKMLSRELRSLELNRLVKREVQDTVPVTVEYSLTDYGYTLDKVIHELGVWGSEHREHLMSEKKN